jgi:2-oxo-4-hydroxy-4-carboxy-5-ureidoimidazoline decarboxylase
MFFFEKKNQKTSVSWACAPCESCASKIKVFLLLFFPKKEVLPFFLSSCMLRRMEINALTRPEFVARLGAIYEHSPWIAERAWAHRPFAGIDALHAAMARVVAEASEAERLALVRAHPDLAGRLARAGALAPASAGEQAGLGLDRLSDEEFDIFEALNTAYREKFGFPFVIAVKRHTRASVVAAFRTRLEHTADQELRTALAEIDMIARFRLEAMFSEEPKGQ